MKDFEGVRSTSKPVAITTTTTATSVAEGSDAAGFAVPTGTSSDGDIENVSLLIGGNLDEGRGNITAYATYSDIKPVTQERARLQRLRDRSQDGTCGGSATNATGNVLLANDYFNRVNVEGDQFVPGTVQFRLRPSSYYQRPDKRYTLGAFAHYELSEQVPRIQQLMFMNDQTVAQFAPAGMFFDFAVDIPCDNPLLSARRSAQWAAPARRRVLAVTSAGATSKEDRAEATYARQLPRRVRVRGDINEAWRYDVSYQYAEVDNTIRNANYTNTQTSPRR